MDNSGAIQCSIGANEEEIEKAIDNKDMDKLVDYILDGDADKLKDKSSDDEAVQELLNGVPKFEVNSVKINVTNLTFIQTNSL